MASPNRATILAKLQKVLRKHYQAVPLNTKRPVLEQLLLACLLENAHPEQAEQALEKLREEYFDWNEIRVTTAKELAEVMRTLPDAEAAANRVRQALQAVFESTYSFELEKLQKLNLGKAVEQLRKLKLGEFAVSHVTQSALGGHSIAVNRGLIEALAVLGAVSEAERAAGVVPGLDRSIPKSKGPEVASILHQFGVDFGANPYSPALHKMLLDVEPSAKSRLPSRRKKQPEPVKPSAPQSKKSAKAEPPAKKAAAAAATPRKKPPAAGKPAGKKPARRPLVAGSKAAGGGKKGAKAAAKKKTATAKLARRKPR